MTIKKSDLNRRDLLKSGVAAGGIAASGITASGIAASGIASTGLAISAAAKEAAPFLHGVASGDPLHDRVILWTRLTLPQGQNGAKIKWQVATDEAFKTIIRQGAAQTGADQDWTIKIDCDGLAPGTKYFYAFTHGDHQSPIGRTRTLPKGALKSLKLGIASCANYNAGWFTAYRGLAEQEDLHAVIHLGDYIYEYASGVYGKNKSRTLKPLHEIITLDDYRQRYAHYRSDSDLQLCHARHPMIAVWDDHEIANDSWRTGAQNHDPQKEGVFSDRQRAARQAYFEWLPIRPRSKNSKSRIYRQFAFGDLAHLIMIDTRHDDRTQQMEFSSFVKKPKTEKEKPRFDAKNFMRVFNDKRRHIMSRTQALWLRRSLNAAARKARWTLIGNQVAFTPTRVPDLASTNPPKFFQPLAQIQALAKQAGIKDLPLSFDSWSGYPAARRNLEKAIQRAGNPTLVLTGDTHHGWAARFGENKKPLGTELATPGIASPGLESYVSDQYRAIWHKEFQAANNSSIVFFDDEHRGFMMVEITPQKAHAQWVWADVSRKSGRLVSGPALVIDHGQPGKPRRSRPHRSRPRRSS